MATLIGHFGKEKRLKTLSFADQFRQLEMAGYIPQKRVGNFEVTHHTVSKHEETITRIQAMQHPCDITRAGTKLCVLSSDGNKWDPVMSDAEMEKTENLSFVLNARGHILIGGLGLGMIVVAILKFKPNEVASITVIEKEQDIIKLILPHLKKLDAPHKITVVHGDIFQFTPPQNAKYDTIWFDIWNTICGDNWPAIKTLKRRFRRFLAQNGWMKAWAEDKVHCYFSRE